MSIRREFVALGSGAAQGTEGDSARVGACFSNLAAGYVSHSQCLEFLCRKGPNLMTKNLKDKEKVCSMLLNIADIVKVLPPADEPVAGDLLDMTLWKTSMCALIQEMKTVEKLFPSLLGSSRSGAYVLTAAPYPAFLRALAAEIADRSS